MAANPQRATAVAPALCNPDVLAPALLSCCRRRLLLADVFNLCLEIASTLFLPAAASTPRFLAWRFLLYPLLPQKFSRNLASSSEETTKLVLEAEIGSLRPSSFRDSMLPAFPRTVATNLCGPSACRETSSTTFFVQTDGNAP